MKRFTKKILILLNIAAVFALCFAYLSNIVDPISFWQFAFFGLAYPLFLIINIGFVFFWWWRKKKILFLSLACILVGFGNIGRYFQPQFFSSSSPEINDVKVMSFNVRVFNHFGWEAGASVRDSILNYIEGESVGVVCLQEFLTRDNASSFQSEEYIKKKLESTPEVHVYYTNRLGKNKTQFGIATFSKFPIVGRGNIQFKNSHNACIYTDIVANSDTIRIYNLHLQSTRLKKYDSYLMDSLLHYNTLRMSDMRAISSSLKQAFIIRSTQVSKIVKHMDESKYPIILCGDFNDTPVSHTYHQLLGKKKDSFREAGSGVSTTYRGKLPSYRIDYIFYSEYFKAKKYKTELIELSDHFPVVSILIPK